jgi:hypothetical protein
VEQKLIDEPTPTQIPVGDPDQIPEDWSEIGVVVSNHSKFRKTGYYVCSASRHWVFLKRFERKSDALASPLFASLPNVGAMALDRTYIESALGNWTLLEHKSDAGISPAEKAIIDAFYDGTPEDRRPLGPRVYDGKNRQVAALIVEKGITAAQVQAAVDWQQRTYWLDHNAPMTMANVGNYIQFWLPRVPTTQPPPADPAVPEESDEEFASRMQEKFGASSQTWDRQIDHNLVTWWLAERGQLQVQLKAATFSQNIASLKLVEAHDNRFWFVAPNAYSRDWVSQHFLRDIRQGLADVGLKDKSRWAEIEIELEVAHEAERMEAAVPSI